MIIHRIHIHAALQFLTIEGSVPSHIRVIGLEHQLTPAVVYGPLPARPSPGALGARLSEAFREQMNFSVLFLFSEAPDLVSVVMSRHRNYLNMSFARALLLIL